MGLRERVRVLIVPTWYGTCFGSGFRFGCSRFLFFSWISFPFLCFTGVLLLLGGFRFIVFVAFFL